MAILPIRPLKHKSGDLVLCAESTLVGERKFIGKIRDTMQSDVYGNVYYIDPFDEFKDKIVREGECLERNTYPITEQLSNELRSIKKSMNDDTILREKICEELCERHTKHIKDRYINNREKLENIIRNIQSQEK